MKKRWSLFLAAVLLLGAVACAKPAEPSAPVATAEPSLVTETAKAPITTPIPAVQAEPTATPVPYWIYDYPYGSMQITVDNAMPDQPQDDGKSLTFADPDGKWTVTFTPIGISETERQMNNLTAWTESKKTFGYYRNVVVEDRTGVYTDLPIAVTYFAFERNPDWVESTQGYTTGAREAHAYWLYQYGDTFIGPWGGLIVELSLPEESTDPLDPVLNEQTVQQLIGQNVFIEGASMQEVSIPGIAVQIPARWQIGTDGDHTLWASIQGATKGSIYFGSSIYEDPKVAAGYIQENYRTLTFGGREWVGDVRTSTLSESTLKSLELFTEFTEYHAASMKLNLYDWSSDEDFWAYTETEAFQAIMESVVLDPASFHNPEDDYKDVAGFECNNINEISAYTGSESELVIPAVVGNNEIVGINYRVFYNNTDLTSVVISEGITYIETDAFRGCTNLKSVVLPNSLTYIDYHAFEDCTALETVVFGNGLIEIGNDAFYNCSALGDVILPDTVVNIGSCAFRKAGSGKGVFVCPADGTVYQNTALSEAKFRSITIGENANLSDHHILDNVVTESITIGEGCTEVGEYFAWDVYGRDTMLTTLNVPSTLKKLGRSAFSGRGGLKSFDFANVTELGDSAFSGAGLEEIVIPGTLKVVPESCFSMCKNVKTIRIDEGVERIEAYAFSSCGEGGGGSAGFYNFLTEEEVEQHKDVVHVDDPAMEIFVNVYLPSTLQFVGSGAFGGTRLDGLYLLWLTSVDQLPAAEDYDVYFTNYECVYVTQEALDACGKELNAYFSQMYKFDAWGGKVRVYEGRHHYWTDEELGIDA